MQKQRHAELQRVHVKSPRPPILDRNFLGFTSQLGQDWFLYHTFFREQQNGTYVDVAAAFPRYISNTSFFDVCAGWNGVCVEADPMKTENLRRHRGCHLVDTCVSNIPGHRVNFTFGSAGNIGETGIIGHNKLGGVTSKHKFRYASVDQKLLSIEMRCVTLGETFAQHGYTRVDLMSLDAEGYEPQIWQSFDKATVQVDVLVVELNSPDMWPEIIDAGLVCVTCFFDCVFVHRLSRHAKRAGWLQSARHQARAARALMQGGDTLSSEELHEETAGCAKAKQILSQTI